MNLSIKNNVIKLLNIILLLSIIYPDITRSEDKKEEYIIEFEKKNYKKSVNLILKKLDEIYSKRVDDKKIPIEFSGYISMEDEEKTDDLINMFRNKKSNPYFIEENKELFKLHYYAGQSFYKLSKNKRSLNHFYESLRFKQLEFDKDDVIFFNIAKVYKNLYDKFSKINSKRKINFFKAYIKALETAFTLNPKKTEYPHILGIELSSTENKKKSIYYFEKYIELQGKKTIKLNIYLTLANLNESIRKYLETEKYYEMYLSKKKDDPYILFALGDLTFNRTGNYKLSKKSLLKALKKLPEDQIFRISKSNEYLGDIHSEDQEYKDAIKYYFDTIKYQKKIESNIKKIESEMNNLQIKINELKIFLLKNQDFDKYTEYQDLRKDKGRIQLKLKKIKHLYKQLNTGEIRWKIATLYEKVDDLKSAIKYYEESINYDFRSIRSAKRIKKIKLKIKRGY